MKNIVASLFWWPTTSIAASEYGYMKGHFTNLTICIILWGGGGGGFVWGDTCIAMQ